MTLLSHSHHGAPSPSVSMPCQYVFTLKRGYQLMCRSLCLPSVDSLTSQCITSQGTHTGRRHRAWLCLRSDSITASPACSASRARLTFMSVMFFVALIFGSAALSFANRKLFLSHPLVHLQRWPGSLRHLYLQMQHGSAQRVIVRYARRARSRPGCL